MRRWLPHLAQGAEQAKATEPRSKSFAWARELPSGQRSLPEPRAAFRTRLRDATRRAVRAAEAAGQTNGRTSAPGKSWPALINRTARVRCFRCFPPELKSSPRLLAKRLPLRAWCNCPCEARRLSVEHL